MRRARRSFRYWGAVAAVAVTAAALPFLGSWAAADRGSGPAAEPRAEGKPKRLPDAPARPPEPRLAPSERVALGVHLEGVTRRPGLVRRYARLVGRPPAIVSYYRKWIVDRTFDRRTLRMLAAEHAIPLVTWEPWQQPLRAIAAGRYDRYLRRTARDARRWRRPVLLRFAHEMNGDWYPWGAQANSQRDYVEAWRQVVRVFRRAGARNVRFVWTPNVDHGGRALTQRLYPGDRYVDWVGLSGFSWGGPWEWQSATHVFRESYRWITSMTRKPFMIAETAAGEVGGDKAKWIEATFAKDLRRLPRVRAVVWFNGKQKWADWDVDSSRESLLAFQAAVASPRYSGTAEDVEQGGRGK